MPACAHITKERDLPSSVYLSPIVKAYVGIPLLMPEVRISPRNHLKPQLTAHEAERTSNGDYEEIDYHTFEAVDYDRLMSWKAGDGRISVGVREMTQQNARVDTVDATLPRGRSAVVDRMNFKLVRAS